MSIDNNVNNGDYFSSKNEAIQYYKSNYTNLEDKPDWLIESLIEFSIKYPNYKEYIEVEHKIKNKIELTEYEIKKYGDLSWEKKTKTYKKDQIIKDAIDINDVGTYDDIARDPVAREKMNKYNLDFGEQLEPEKEVKIKLTTDDGEYIVKAEVEKLNNGVREFEIEKLNNILEIENNNI
jgi:hypothetical protein